MDRAVCEPGTLDGFAAVTLRNAAIAATFVPALGARLVSLRAAPGGREWMWRPADGRGLFTCPVGTPFENSPAAGLDECLPTVADCVVDGVPLADHGEAWSRAWTHDPTETDAVTTAITLRSWPLQFRRRATLDGASLVFNYALTNNAAHAVPYLWASHPLFTLEPGDEIVLDGTAEVRVASTHASPLQTGEHGPWPSPRAGVRLNCADFGCTAGGYAKAFLPTRRAPRIALVDRTRGERLTLAVDPAQVPAWGYWVSRGGWHGHTHLALEATNAPADALAELVPGPAAHTLAPRETREWRVSFTLGPA